MVTVQIPSLILPSIMPLGGFLGTETEALTDLLEHTSIEVPVDMLQEKTIHIMATEVVGAGVPGNLWAWVELSPYPSTVATAYWSAIGGGGGALVPVAPFIEVGTGVNGTVHTFALAWNIHSAYARVVVQTPVAGALATAWWVVQAIIEAKTP